MKIIPDSVPNIATHPAIWRMFEPSRMMVEMGALAAATPLLVPQHTSDGHPVIVVTGLWSPSMGTMQVRGALRLIGHHVYSPPVHMMYLPPQKIRSTLLKMTEELYEKYDGDKVSLVGWCVGGAFTRMVAHAAPDKVRQVINMGTSLEGWWYPKDQKFAAGRLPVPSTVIYSRTDGTMDWRKIVEKPAPRTENIEVLSSHFGMANNPMTLHIIADRLMQPKGAWRPFSGWTLEQAGDKASAAGKVA